MPALFPKISWNRCIILTLLLNISGITYTKGAEKDTICDTYWSQCSSWPNDLRFPTCDFRHVNGHPSPDVPPPPQYFSQLHFFRHVFSLCWFPAPYLFHIGLVRCMFFLMCVCLLKRSVVCTYHQKCTDQALPNSLTIIIIIVDLCCVISCIQDLHAWKPTLCRYSIATCHK